MSDSTPLAVGVRHCVECGNIISADEPNDIEHCSKCIADELKQALRSAAEIRRARETVAEKILTLRNIKEFADWFLSQPIDFSHAPADGIYRYETEGGTVTSLILFRKSPFQAELFTAWPSAVGPGYFPEHTHPNVDSIEVPISGAANFTLRGQPIAKELFTKRVSSTGALWIAGSRIRVRPSVRHGANLGAQGGAFLSLQHWLNDVQPTSVGLDWKGPEHLEIRNGG